MVCKPPIFRLRNLLIVGLLPATVSASDLSILGTYSSGDFGNAVESRIQSTWLRLATGDPEWIERSIGIEPPKTGVGGVGL